MLKIEEKIMKKIWILFIVAAFLCLVTSIAFAGSTKEITVSAAMSLKNAFEEIGKVFEARHGTQCVFNFASSGDLMRQIVGGAPVDVYASAAQKDMDDAEKRGSIITATRTDFTANSVVLIVPAQIKTSLSSFEGLKAPGIKKIAIGNPMTVPAGRYAEEVCNFYHLLPAIKDKLIYAEHVRQVLDYVARGEVDAGIVYSTDAAINANEVKIIVAAPGKSHKPIVYPLAIVKGTKNETDAKAFISLVLSQRGQEILQKYGFRPIK
jgi:molybdate transport system substrate-binding protein